MNLDLLMNARPAIEEGLAGWFNAQALTAFTRQNAPESFQTVRPRVECLCKIGAATGHRSVIGGVIYHDAWGFDLAIRAVTEPSNISADNLEHDQLVARIRGMMQTFGQATWVDTVNFPYHLIVEPLKDTTTDDNLKVEDNEEFSVLTFSGIVQVRTDAWTNT